MRSHSSKLLQTYKHGYKDKGSIFRSIVQLAKVRPLHNTHALPNIACLYTICQEILTCHYSPRFTILFSHVRVFGGVGRWSSEENALEQLSKLLSLSYGNLDRGCTRRISEASYQLLRSSLSHPETGHKETIIPNLSVANTMSNRLV